jgi:hypothetical protein
MPCWCDAADKVEWVANTVVGRLESRDAFSLDKPQFVFNGDANAVKLNLSAKTRLNLLLNGIDAGGVFIEAVTDVHVPVNVRHEGGCVKLS